MASIRKFIEVQTQNVLAKKFKNPGIVPTLGMAGPADQLIPVVRFSPLTFLSLYCLYSALLKVILRNSKKLCSTVTQDPKLTEVLPLATSSGM